MSTTTRPGRWPARARRATGTATALAVALVGQLPADAHETPEAAADDALTITSVRVTDDEVVVEGTGATPAADVAVHTGSPSATTADLVDDTVEGDARADASGVFTVTLPRTSGAEDRLYDQFVAVAGDGVSDGHFPDDFAFTPTYDYPYQPPASKKGLSGTQMADDVEELGATSSKFNVAFQNLMDAGPAADPATQITFESQGQTYYFNRAYVANMDKQVTELSDAGAPPYFVLLLQNVARENSALDVLLHPGAQPGGAVYAFNTVTDEGIAHYAAAVEFLTDRYSRADARYGRGAGWVVGNEIDAQWVWGNAGEMTVDEYLDHYMNTLRITYLAARKATTEPVVMTSLTKHWNSSHDINPLRSYKPRDILDGLAERSQQTGDFPWHLAFHSYPENLRDPEFWDDTTATPDVDTKIVTFKNLEVLVDYMRRPELLYRGEQRRIALTEQGFDTPPTADGELVQAAAYALAYYRVAFLDGIDAFVNQRHVTHGNEGGLLFGLWTQDTERSEPNAPGDKKPIYDVFKYIDTERSLEVTEFALDVIGIEDWSEMVPGFDPDKLAVRDLPAAVGTDIDAATAIPGPMLSDFSTDTDGWEATVNSSSVEHTPDGPDHSTGALRVNFATGAGLSFWSLLAKTWKGTEVDLSEPIDASATPYLTIPVRVPDPGNLGARYAKVTLDGADGQVAEGTAVITGSDWTNLTLDLSDWAGTTAISRVKVWVRGSTNVDWVGAYDVGSGSFSGIARPTDGSPNVAVEAVATERPEAGTEVELTVTNHASTPVRSALRTVACDGTTLATDEFDLAGLTTGNSATVTSTLTEYDPIDDDNPVLCLAYRQHQVRVPLDIQLPPGSDDPLTPTTVLWDFEDETAQGWTAGANVESVDAVTSFLNGPARPKEGSYALEATNTTAPADAARVISVAPASPLDLTDAETFVMSVNSYGAGGLGVSGYEAIVRVWSGDDMIEAQATGYRPNAWNTIAADVSDWPGRSSITKIEISFRAIGSSQPWGARFQIDQVGWL